MLDIIAWVFLIPILGTYFMSAFYNKHIPFMWVNVFGAIVMGSIMYRQEAWQPLALTAGFGIIGLIGLFQYYKPLQDRKEII
jgi:hypothetical protein